MTKKILITGGNGYIGSNLSRYLAKEYDLTLLNRSIVDLTDSNTLSDWFENKFFDVIIHTAIKGGSRLQKDQPSIIDYNISIYNNLLRCKDHYNRFINLGSGAEIYDLLSPYGLSKRAIYESLQDKDNYFSLRIFGIFDHNELNSRFIKTSLYRYIHKKNIILFQNKLMDFIYFTDFAKIINFYITNTNPPKNLDCVYKNKISLYDIADIIIHLDDYNVDIEILEDIMFNDYIGVFTELNLDFDGLNTGIINTYKEMIKYEKNMVCP